MCFGCCTGSPATEAPSNPISSFLENLKEKFQPQAAQNPTEAASEATKAVSESAPETSNAVEGAVDAVKSVSESAPEAPAPEAPANAFSGFV